MLDPLTLLILILVVGSAAVGLPILGAVKAGQGEYFRYPIVGESP